MNHIADRARSSELITINFRERKIELDPIIPINLAEILRQLEVNSSRVRFGLLSKDQSEVDVNFLIANPKLFSGEVLTGFLKRKAEDDYQTVIRHNSSHDRKSLRGNFLELFKPIEEHNLLRYLKESEKSIVLVLVKDSRKQDVYLESSEKDFIRKCELLSISHISIIRRNFGIIFSEDEENLLSRAQTTKSVLLVFVDRKFRFSSYIQHSKEYLFDSLENLIREARALRVSSFTKKDQILEFYGPSYKKTIKEHSLSHFRSSENNFHTLPSEITPLTPLVDKIKTLVSEGIKKKPMPTKIVKIQMISILEEDMRSSQSVSRLLKGLLLLERSPIFARLSSQLYSLPESFPDFLILEAERAQFTSSDLSTSDLILCIETLKSKGTICSENANWFIEILQTIQPRGQLLLEPLGFAQMFQAQLASSISHFIGNKTDEVELGFELDKIIERVGSKRTVPDFESTQKAERPREPQYLEQKSKEIDRRKRSFEQRILEKKEIHNRRSSDLDRRRTIKDRLQQENTNTLEKEKTVFKKEKRPLQMILEHIVQDFGTELYPGEIEAIGRLSEAEGRTLSEAYLNYLEDRDGVDFLETIRSLLANVARRAPRMVGRGEKVGWVRVSRVLPTLRLPGETGSSKLDEKDIQSASSFSEEKTISPLESPKIPRKLLPSGLNSQTLVPFSPDSRHRHFYLLSPVSSIDKLASCESDTLTDKLINLIPTNGESKVMDDDVSCFSNIAPLVDWLSGPSSGANWQRSLRLTIDAFVSELINGVLDTLRERWKSTEVKDFLNKLNRLLQTSNSELLILLFEFKWAFAKPDRIVSFVNLVSEPSLLFAVNKDIGDAAHLKKRIFLFSKSLLEFFSTQKKLVGGKCCQMLINHLIKNEDEIFFGIIEAFLFVKDTKELGENLLLFQQELAQTSSEEISQLNFVFENFERSFPGVFFLLQKPSDRVRLLSLSRKRDPMLQAFLNKRQDYRSQSFLSELTSLVIFRTAEVDSCSPMRDWKLHLVSILSTVNQNKLPAHCRDEINTQIYKSSNTADMSMLFSIYCVYDLVRDKGDLIENITLFCKYKFFKQRSHIMKDLEPLFRKHKLGNKLFRKFTNYLFESTDLTSRAEIIYQIYRLTRDEDEFVESLDFLSRFPDKS